VPPELRALLPQGPPPEPREPADFRSRQTAYGRELYFPPFRARGFAMGMLFFTLCWSTVTAVLFVVDVPVFFALVFAAFAVLLLVVTLDLFFGSTRIVLGADRVTIHRQFFNHKETILPRREIATARAAIGSSNGNRPYYDVEVQTTGGKKVKAAKYIRSKREAEWVASQIGER
jgi:hypothetical protein